MNKESLYLSTIKDLIPFLSVPELETLLIEVYDIYDRSFGVHEDE